MDKRRRDWLDYATLSGVDIPAPPKVNYIIAFILVLSFVYLWLFDLIGALFYGW